MDLTQSTVMILMTRRNRCILCFFYVSYIEVPFSPPPNPIGYCHSCLAATARMRLWNTLWWASEGHGQPRSLGRAAARTWLSAQGISMLPWFGRKLLSVLPSSALELFISSARKNGNYSGPSIAVQASLNHVQSNRLPRMRQHDGDSYMHVAHLWNFKLTHDSFADGFVRKGDPGDTVAFTIMFVRMTIPNFRRHVWTFWNSAGSKAWAAASYQYAKCV